VHAPRLADHVATRARACHEAVVDLIARHDVNLFMHWAAFVKSNRVISARIPKKIHWQKV